MARKPDAAAAVEIDDAEESQAPKTSSRKIPRILFIVLPLVLLPATAGAWLGYDHFPVIVEAAASVGLDFGIVNARDEVEPVQYGHFQIIKDLVINPAGTNGKRFLLVELGLESQTEKVFEEISRKDIVVRDAILRILSQCTVDELTSIDRRDELKTQIRDTINAFLDKGQIDRLYFTQYVLQ